MESRIAELRDKEIINISDGCRFGYVGDVEVDLETGKGYGKGHKAQIFKQDPVNRKKVLQFGTYCAKIP